MSRVPPLHEPVEPPPGFGVRQPSAPFGLRQRGRKHATVYWQAPVPFQSGRGLPHSKTLTLRSQGKLAEAEDLHRQALQMQTNLLGSANVPVATSLSNLGLALQEAGKFTEAEACFRQALALFQKLRGAEHPSVALVLDNLASVLREENKLEEAESLQVKAVAMQKRLLGEEHKDVAMQKRLLGEEHKDVATPLNNLAQVLAKKGDLAKAEALHRQALAMRQKLLPSEHVEVASSLENLALVLRAEAVSGGTRSGEGPVTAQASAAQRTEVRAPERLKEAEDLGRRALAMREKILGGQDLRAGKAFDSLGLILRDQGRLAEAGAAFRRSLEITRKAAGGEHPLLAVAFEH